jgi:hypothetical protein
MDFTPANPSANKGGVKEIDAEERGHDPIEMFESDDAEPEPPKVNA